MRKFRKEFFIGISLIGLFIVWTILLQYLDLGLVETTGTYIGMSGVNLWFHKLTGVHMWIYYVTDWLGLVPVTVCIGFGVLGLVQLIRRRSLLKVDGNILVLGVYYVVVIVAYFLFEMMPLNYRPILIEGRLEASYPSSTTLLVLSVMPTLGYQLKSRIGRNHRVIARICSIITHLFVLGMVLGRLVSGVHWITDIVGAVLLSLGLYYIYQSICNDLFSNP